MSAHRQDYERRDVSARWLLATVAAILAGIALLAWGASALPGLLEPDRPPVPRILGMKDRLGPPLLTDPETHLERLRESHETRLYTTPGLSIEEAMDRIVDRGWTSPAPSAPPATTEVGGGR